MFGLITLLMHQRYGLWAVSRHTYPGHFSFTKFLPEVFDRVDADERSDKKANQLDAAHQTNGYAVNDSHSHQSIENDLNPDIISQA